MPASGKFTENGASRPSIFVLGCGGHGTVVAEALILSGENVVGFIDEHKPIGQEPISGLPIVGGDDYLDQLNPKDVKLAMGIGFLPKDTLRRSVYRRAKDKGFSFTKVVHPSTTISPSVILEEGAQVLAGAIIQAASAIGENVIVNTGAQVDHHGDIGSHSHVAPGAILCGNVRLGEGSFVGAGAIVVQGSKIGDGEIVKAGQIFHRGSS